MQDKGWTRLLVASAGRGDVAQVVGGSLLQRRLRRSHPHVHVDLTSSWEYDSLDSLLGILRNTSIYVSGCGQASLAALFLPEGAHLVLVATAPESACLEADMLFASWQHLHLHLLPVPCNKPSSSRAANRSQASGPGSCAGSASGSSLGGKPSFAALCHSTPFGLYADDLRHLGQDEDGHVLGLMEQDLVSLLHRFPRSHSARQREKARGGARGRWGQEEDDDVVREQGTAAAQARCIETYYRYHREQTLQVGTAEVYAAVVNALHHISFQQHSTYTSAAATRLSRIETRRHDIGRGPVGSRGGHGPQGGT